MSQPYSLLTDVNYNANPTNFSNGYNSESTIIPTNGYCTDGPVGNVTGPNSGYGVVGIIPEVHLLIRNV